MEEKHSFYKNFQKTEADTLPNMFYGANITQIPKPDKEIIKKEITNHHLS